jgi:MFS family permease
MAAKSVYVALPKKITDVRVGSFPALASLAYTNFRFLWAVTFFISSSFWTYQVVIGWLVYDLTKSPMLTSFALGTQFLPMLVMAPVCGILSDRYNRQSLLAFVIACKVVVMAIFAIVVMLGQIQVGYIFGFSILVGIMWCVSINARTSIVPDIVPRENLVNAYALKGLAGNASGMIMPAVVGVLIARLDAGYALMTGTLLLVAAIISALRLNIKPVDATERGSRVGFTGFIEAVRFIKQESVIINLVIL